MSHIAESCPLTKLNGGLSRLHSADGDAVSWLTNYGSWLVMAESIRIVFVLSVSPITSHDTHTRRRSNQWSQYDL